MSEPLYDLDEVLSLIRAIAEDYLGECDDPDCPCDHSQVRFAKSTILHLVAEAFECLPDPRCALCGEDTIELGEYYMVTEELWEAHGVPHGVLCIGCLEQRMGRELIPSDFADVEVNTHDCDNRSDRLKTRLGNPVVADWQVAMLSLFGSMDEVDVSTSCHLAHPEPVMTTEAVHRKTGLRASVEHGRSATPEEAGGWTIKAMEKLHALMHDVST